MNDADDVIALQDVLADPDRLTALRRLGPVHRATLANGTAVWLIVGYQEAIVALSDPRLSVAAMMSAGVLEGGTLSPDLRDGLLKSLTSSDPPDHTRLRRLVSGVFTPRRIEAMRPWISRLTDELIDGFAQHDRVELMAELAVPLPMLVISELLGIPEADRPRFQTWSRALISGLGSPHFPIDVVTEHLRYLRDLIAYKRAHPDEGLISALIRARDEDGALSANELTSMITLMILAGHDTTLSLIGNGVYLLMREPDWAAKIREDQGLLPGAIEEFFRVESPVPVANLRAAVDPLEIGGTRIMPGDIVAISLQSANRDESQFPRASEFDPTRTGGRHLGLGHGIHYCLGAPLARLEGELAIGALLRRFPTLRLAVPLAELTWSQAMFVHRLDTLPLLLS
jgi:cytochrome P450